MMDTNIVTAIPKKPVPNLTVRKGIMALEHGMIQLPQLEILPKHYFADGIYAREILIPAGTLLTGMIHKTQTIDVVSYGDISVLTEAGVKRIQGPCTLISQPGIKKVGYAHTDTLWTTIHANRDDLTDLNTLEELLVTQNYEDLIDDQSIKDLLLEVA